MSLLFFFFSFCTCSSMKATEREGLPPQRHHWFRRRWRHRSSLRPRLCGDVSVSVLMRLWLLLLLLLLGTFSSAQLGAFRRRTLQFLSLSPATNSWDFAFMTLMKRLNYRPMRTTSYKWGKFNFSLFGVMVESGFVWTLDYDWLFAGVVLVVAVVEYVKVAVSFGSGCTRSRREPEFPRHNHNYPYSSYPPTLRLGC